MRWNDERRFFRDKQVFAQAEVILAKPVDLLPEHNRVEHHAVTDDVEDVAAKNTRRNLVKHVLKTTEFERVPRVGATLKPGYHLILRSQHVHNFTFSFVAPLEAH